MMERFFDGFIDLHPSYKAKCRVCSSEAYYYDEELNEEVCMNCCDHIAYARNEIELIELHISNWIHDK